MGPRTLIIVNPASGGGRARHLRAEIADYLEQQGCAADFVESGVADDLRRRAREASAGGYGLVVALGGDGAFHHLLEGAFGQDVTLGIIPAGNGNDIAAGLGIPADPIAAAHDLLHAEARAVDVIRARFPEGPSPGQETIYMGAGGMGLDAEAAQLANGRFRRLPGLSRYLAGALFALKTFRPLEIEAQMDEHRWSGRVILAAVANGPRYGAGVRIAPSARMDDGWLDVTLVGAMPWPKLVEAIPVALRNQVWNWENVRHFRARKVALRASRPAAFQGDGELLGNAPVELEVLPGAVRMALPRRIS